MERQKTGVDPVMVGEEGIEPSWYCYHWILSPTRLPIPPFARFVDYSIK